MRLGAEVLRLLKGLGRTVELFQYAHLTPAGLAVVAALIERQRLAQPTLAFQLLGQLESQPRMAGKQVRIVAAEGEQGRQDGLDRLSCLETLAPTVELQVVVDILPEAKAP